ncbi:hypothetical protein VA7868_02817 [Vibrio aerogenes CECT 7868]|uniref:Rhs family protein n=1 Tax=Vibrio aerogenes CECT 7868 TaxID=1216006 RepID=A0A1M5ZJQ1_9VIBR|nr:Rhs family protein [Vibrio aerogenes]SHI24369.1 hypothetical protein VA7868_02817 [Vibrio aerogenes CECT 7868]
MTDKNATNQFLDEKFNAVKADFMSSIDEYKKQSENLLYGWALEMDQKVMVNGHTKSADIDDSSIRADIVKCPLDGKLTLVHCFEAESFIPIGGTPFKIQPVKVKKHWFRSDSYIKDGPPYEDTIGEDGHKDLHLDKATYAGKMLQINFQPDVTQSDMNRLLQSYDVTLNSMMNWLESQWKSQKEEWADFLAHPIDVGAEVKRFLHNAVIELVKAWDEIADLFKLLSHPTQLIKTLAKYVENPELIVQKIQEAGKEAVEMLMMLKDEARCFLCVKAVFCWIQLLSPRQIIDFVSVSLASVLVEVILSVVVPGGIISKSFEKLRDVAGMAQGVIDG